MPTVELARAHLPGKRNEAANGGRGHTEGRGGPRHNGRNTKLEGTAKRPVTHSNLTQTMAQRIAM
eukprot:3266156-Lingulodinium_polyedra.AAC.1